MLRRFLKTGYDVVDVSIINLRRFSIKYSTDLENDVHSNEDYEKEYIDLTKVEKKDGKGPFIIKCKRPGYNFYENQTYSKFKPIPLTSRGWQHRDSRGDYFTIYPLKNDQINDVDTSKYFKNLNINKQLVDNLESLNIISPTRIQALSIPKILDAKNIIITAETGCGKTYAFLLPLLHQINKWKLVVKRKFNSPLGLIITPSQELTHQIYDEAKKLSKKMNLNIRTYIGGETKKISRDPQVHNVDLIIASLGVLSKLVTWNIYNMKYVRHVVLDEADILLDVTFKEKLCYFLDKIPIVEQRSKDSEFPHDIQLTLSSATIPENLPTTLHTFVKNNVLEPVTSGNQHQIIVLQKFLRLGPSEKPMELLKLLKSKTKSKIPIIIFSNTTKTCDFISLFLNSYNINCIRLHGDMPFEYKKGKFKEFQNGVHNVLVTTDAGARGLDTIHVQLVINYDFPLITSEYIHRCGRTGRLGSPENCRVINFISRPIEILLTNKIEFATRKRKAIPMIDMIHKSDETEFLNSKIDRKSNVKGNDNGDNVESDDEFHHGIPI